MDSRPASRSRNSVPSYVFGVSPVASGYSVASESSTANRFPWVRGGISLVEVIIALAVLATLAASLAASMASNTKLRNAVVAAQNGAVFQRGLLETCLSTPSEDFTTQRWATGTLGYTQAIREQDVNDSTVIGYARGPADVRSGDVLPAAGVPEKMRIFVQYHWAETTSGHRGLLDAGLDGSDLDSAPDPWPSASEAEAGMRDPTVLAATLIPDGIAALPTGTPFVVRIIVAWDDEGQGTALGRVISSTAAAGLQTMNRATTMFIGRSK